MEIGEKLDRLTVPPVFQNRAAFQVGTTFLQNPSRKTLDGLYKSCRGVVRSTTFLFVVLCTSIQKFWENAVEHRHTDTFWSRVVPDCAASRRTPPARAGPPRRPCPTPPESSSAPRPLEVLPLLARCASHTPRPTGRTDRRRTGGHHGAPPLSRTPAKTLGSAPP
jgi:hypothetical protein